MPFAVTRQAEGIRAFLEAPGPILDVRSPGEYAHAHLPGAVNWPIFSDEERAEVGTLYKKEGRSEAIELGLRYFSGKMVRLLERAKEVCPGKRARLYCWRGGMRSQAMAMLLSWGSIESLLLPGGYKMFRRWVLHRCSQPPPKIINVTGLTGCGKSALLREMAKRGAQVCDLEALAEHRGSVFGGYPGRVQPSSEQFENSLALELARFDESLPVWMEDESLVIGQCRLPEKFFEALQKAPLVEIMDVVERRIESLVSEYLPNGKEILIESTRRLSKRLGDERMRHAVRYLEEGNGEAWVRQLLPYYDNLYGKSIERRREAVIYRSVRGERTFEDWAKEILCQTLTESLEG